MNDSLTIELGQALAKVARDTNNYAKTLLEAKTKPEELSIKIINRQSELTALAIASYVEKKILNSMQTNSLQIKKV